MSSQAQIDANRRNAKKSTGPVSPEGKAACSLNALKSGLYASSHVIPGEDPAELEALTAAYFHQYQPADPTQLALVDTLVATEWTQRRLRRIEAELWAFQLDSLDQNITRAEFTDPAFQHKSPLGRSYLNALEAFSRLQRRIESTNRMYLRTLKALQDLQKAPPEQAGQATAPPPEPGSPLAGGKRQLPREPQPLTPPIGFVPSFTPAAAARPRVSHENHESSLQTEALLRQNTHLHRDTIHVDRSSCLQRTFQAVPSGGQ
jgi:hypothetical protein